MKTYLRILAYARPYKGAIFLYTIFTILSVVFAGLTFSMLQPLLELLFNPDKQIVAPQPLPEFHWSGAYFAHFFEHYKHVFEYKAHQIRAEVGKSQALLYVTLFIVGLNLLSNFFKFISSYNLGTIRT